MANDQLLNPGETLGDAVQAPPQQAAPQLNDGETLGDPVQQPGAVSRFGSGVVAGTKAMLGGDIPSLKDIAIEGAVGPAMQVIKMPVNAYKAYKQAREEGQPIVSSVASGAAGLVGVDAQGIRERASKGDVAGIVGESVPAIAATIIGGEHEHIGKVFQSDARALETANATHQSASAAYDQRLREQYIANDQAVAASKKAQQTTEALGTDPNVTQQHVDQANTTASEAAANARKSTQALNDAHTQRAEAAVQVDRLNRKIQGTANKVSAKQTKDIVGAKEDFQKAIPPAPSGKAAYTDRDYDIARGYLEKHHENIEQVNSVQGAFDAFDNVQKDIENKVTPYREKYAKEPIQTNVRMDVRDQLAENPNTSFVQRGMAALEDYNLSDPTIEEAEAIRKQLNSDVRGTLQQTHWDVQTAIDTDPVFAAKYAALDSLRDGIYNTFEDKGVKGIREIRQDEASVIRLRNAAQRQLTKGDVRLRGSGGSGPWRKMLGKGTQTALAGAGAATGLGTGIPGAAEAGAMIGSHYGNKLGTLIAPGDLTRNAMIERSMKIKGGGVPVTDIEGRPQPATQFGPPQPVSPIMQLYTPQRENTPLHSELATHYGEDVNTSYLDLEKRFKEDVLDKKAHGVPLEPAEKTLLGKINLADANDRLKAAQQAQKMAAEQKPAPRATLPEEFDPLLHPPQSSLAEGMDTRIGIVHDLAHIVVGSERGIDFRDGIRSHLHPENQSAGALMSAPIDWEPFLNEDGEVDPAKLKAKISDIATTYVAGGVANDLYHDVPFTENHHLGADVRILKSFLKNTGFTEAEATKMIAQAADDAAQILSRPGVQDILEKHAAVREQGLDPNYHISPERAELIKLDVKGALDEHPTGNTARPTPERDRSGKADGAGEKAKPEDRNSAELRQAGQGTDKGKTGAMGQAESVSAKPDSEAAGTDRVKESPVIESLKDVLKKGVEKGSYSQDTADDVLNKSRQAEQTRNPKDIVGERPPEFKPIERPAGGWDSETTISPDNPKFDNQDDKYEIPTEPRYLVGDPGPGMKFNKPDHEVLTHELGHALNGLDEGIDTHGVLSHKHPLVSSRAAARMDMDGMLNHENGELRPERVAAYARAAMGGIAADEVFNNRPRSSNINFSMTTPGTDANLTAKALELSGVDPEDIPGMLHQMVDTGKKYLTNPAVSDVIKENLGVREPGLPDSYHYSPTRLRQMYAEAQRRIQNGRLNGTNTGEANTGNSESVPGKQEENPGRTGEEVQATAIAPENPKFGGLNERTTGDPDTDSAIKEAGAIPAGIMFPGSDYQIKMFHDPQTGSTLGFKPGEQVTPDAIQQKLADSRKQFGIKPENPKLDITDKIKSFPTEPGYSKTGGKDALDLHNELEGIYNKYREYNDPAYGGGDFMSMVKKFAGDDFYNAHNVAKEYLSKIKPENPQLGKMVSETGKPFDEQKYPHTQHVRVDWPEYGDTIEDSVKGLNKGHALARARENWPGATITPIDAKNPQLGAAEPPQASQSPAPGVPAPAQVPGMIIPGNLNLNTRPIIHNEDGSHSSEYSISMGDSNGHEVLVPTVVNGKFLTPDGKKPKRGSSEEKQMFKEAWKHYEKTGEHLGIFDTPEHADQYAQIVHNRKQVDKSKKLDIPKAGLDALGDNNGK